MDSKDVTYEQNLRIQRALMKDQRKVDNNKVVVGMMMVIVAVIVLF